MPAVRHPPANCAPSGHTTAGTTRSSSHSSSSSTPHHRDQSAPAEENHPRPPQRPGPHPTPSSTSHRTATTLGKLASGLLLISGWADEQLPATSTTPREKRRRTPPARQFTQRHATGR